jgi:hypothetical protein
MEISLAMTTNSYTMPALRNNQRWTMTETRSLIRMCRLEDCTTEEMAQRLERTPDAVRYRLAKLFVEHMDGREATDENIKDVSDWLVNVGE